MLVIRDEQMRILNRSFEVAFRRKVCEYLESDFPEQCRALGPEGVRELIEHGVATAKEYGVEFEDEICDWIAMMAEFGRDFDKLEWAAGILRDTSDPIRSRMSRLMGWADAIRRVSRKA